MIGNTKKFLDAAKRHIMSYYREGGKKALLADGNSAGGWNDYQKGVKLAQTGSFDIYYDDQRKTLEKLYGRKQPKNSHFTNDEVFKKYCHICGRAYEAIAKEKPKKRHKKAVGHKKAVLGGKVGFFI